MRHHTRFLIFSVILLTIASLLILRPFRPHVVSAQGDPFRSLYDNDERFNELSGAARTVLELKFGKKDRKGGVGTAATSEAGIEGAQPAGNVGGSVQISAAHSEFSPPISDSSFSSSPSVLGFFQGISPHSKRQDALAGWA